MKVRFWGTRGSLPASIGARDIEHRLRQAIAAMNGVCPRPEEVDSFIAGLPFAVRGTYGTNTSCIELDAGSPDHVLCDAGTGLRDFGRQAVKNGPARYHIFLSHPHWDHIQGFPFFIPAYIPGNTITFYGLHDSLAESLRVQSSSPWFPVDFSQLGADIDFVRLEPDKDHHVAGFTVSTLPQKHPGDSYGYSFRRDGRKIVYSTDNEHDETIESDEYPFLDFAKNADLLVFDAQYTLAESLIAKLGWGHSSNITAVEMAVRSNTRRLALFHTEPSLPDSTIDRLLAETRTYLDIYAPDSPLEIVTAWDGLVIDL